MNITAVSFGDNNSPHRKFQAAKKLLKKIENYQEMEFYRLLAKGHIKEENGRIWFANKENNK